MQQSLRVRQQSFYLHVLRMQLVCLLEIGNCSGRVTGFNQHQRVLQVLVKALRIQINGPG